MIASLPEQFTLPRPLIWHLTFKIKFKVEGKGTGYHPEITSARVQNDLIRQLAFLGSLHNHDLQPGI